MREGPATQNGALDTAEQLAAERLLLELLADPDVRAIMAALEKELLDTANAQSAEARPALPSAIAGWTATLILSECACNPERPLILWGSDDAPHRWHGIDVPPRVVWGNDPNFIYRRSYLDGAYAYEVTGQIHPARRPAQMLFEVKRGTPGDQMLNLGNRGKSMDFGNQIGMLSDRTLSFTADGRFRFTIGGEQDGPDHVATQPGPIQLTIRDVLSDWRQLPPHLAIRRRDGGRGAARGTEWVREQLLKDLPGHLRFWGNFPDEFYAKSPLGALNGPVPRDGGWGYVASVRFELAADQVVLIRTVPTDARYVGVQFSDRWGQVPDGQRHFSSLNNAQAVADPDGGFTYVTAPTDPGIANWIDSAGLLEGGMGLRWQGFPPGGGTPELVRDFRIINRAELDALPDIARVTPQQRQRALEQRVRDFRTRLSQP